MTEITDFDSALVALEPHACGKYVYCAGEGLPEDVTPFALIWEAEGLTALIPYEQAQRHGIKYRHAILARISLGINSSVKLSGLTATVARHLASAMIPCNLIGGMHHDHLFVPATRAKEAMKHLADLSAQARGWVDN